jgi:hypothetical protein
VTLRDWLRTLLFTRSQNMDTLTLMGWDWLRAQGVV